MKIHIIGCSGSGKTYLAKHLSKKHQIPHIDLDDIQWDNASGSYGVKNPVEKRIELLDEALKNESWIIEGVYFSWVENSFKNADIIYFIDVPRRVYRYRIIKRFILRKLGIERGKKESLSSVKALLKWTDTFQSENVPQIKKMLLPYSDKVHYLKSKRDIKKLLK